MVNNVLERAPSRTYAEAIVAKTMFHILRPYYRNWYRTAIHIIVNATISKIVNHIVVIILSLNLYIVITQRKVSCP